MSLPAGFWLLTVIGVLGEFGPLTVRRQRGGIYLSVCTSVAILLIWGPWPALAAQTAASIVAAWRSRLGLAATGFLVARAAAAIGAAAAVVAAADLGTLRRIEGIDRSVLVDLLLLIGAWLVAYYTPAIVIERWVRHESWRTLRRRGFGVEAVTSASLLFLAPIIVAEPRGWTFALLALPLLALNQLSGLVTRQAVSLRRDAVTGLLNQRGLVDIADEVGRSRRGEPGRYAVLLIRLHSVRDLADAFGRPIVDAVLAGVGGRLVAAFGDMATVGRPDTDDLVVLVPRTGRAPGDDAPVDSAVATVHRAIETPVIINGLPYDAAATIGTARCPEDAENLASLLRQADAAIRYGRPRRDRVIAYTPTPQEEIEQRLDLLTDLRAALAGDADAGRIEFVYQPQVRLDSGDVVAVEALLRWMHPGRGAVSPDALIMVAEPTPLMHDLTRLAVRSVTEQIEKWNNLGVRLQAALNVSVRDLGQDWLVDAILDRVAGTEIAPGQLVIEVTENEIISDPDQVRSAVDRLTAAGIQVSVDDFGSGYASLQHLRQLPLSQLKIDKGLVRTIADHPADRAVVRSVIELARALGLTVVAEGVENQAVHRTLRRLGCAMGQGWFYGKPVSGPDVVPLAAAKRRPGGPSHRFRGGSSPLA